MISRATLLWINRLLWTLLVGAVVLLGSVVSLGRYYVPYIEAHQRDIVTEFNRRTGLQLSVGRLAGSWQHLSPHFVIDNLQLQNPRDASAAALQIEHMELQLGIFRSIDARTIAISRLQARGVRVQLEEATLGHWQLAGFGGTGTLQFDRIVDMLLAIYRAELRDSHIDLHFFGGGEAHLVGDRVQLQRADSFRRFNLSLKFADNGAPLSFVLEANGDPRAHTFYARGYAAFRGVDLTPVLPAIKTFGINLEHGRIDGAAWIDWRPDGAIELRGRTEMPQLDLAGISSVELPPVKNVKAEFLIRDRAGVRQLWLPALTGTWNEVALNFRHLLLTTDAQQPERVQLALPELQLLPLREVLLAVQNLPESLRNTLTELAPRGTLHNLHVELPLRPEQRDTLRARAQLHDVAVQPIFGAPGVEGLTGYIDAGWHSGHVDLVSDNFNMAFPHVYREALHFDAARGQIGWRIESDRVLVNSGPIAVRSDAGRATAQFALDLPDRHGATPLMTLQVGMQNSAAQYRDRFIPYTLQPSLLQWLQRAIGPGDVPAGGFIYRGSLLANDHLNNTVQLFLQVSNAQLAYQPEWPPLHDLRAAVWVDDSGLRVTVPSARLYDRIVLRNSEVELQHDGDVSWLTVSANAAADNDDILRLLRETPLRKQIGSTLDRWRWRGPTQSHVELGIAVSGTRPLDINVDSRIDGGTLNLVDQNIVLDDVRGDLNYRSDNNGRGETGLQATALAAKWFAKPVAIKVATARDGNMTIDASGRVAMSDLKTWLRQPLFDFTSGDAPFAATLRVASGAATLAISSDLQGASIDLPAPYRKSSEQTLPLTVAMQLNPDTQLEATLADWADLRLRWNKTDAGISHLNAGVVRLDRTGRQAFSEGQFVITGAVKTIDFNAWRDLLRARTSPPASADDRSDGDMLPVQIREMHFDSALIAGQMLRDLFVSGRRDSAAWTVQMRAEQIAGTVTLPDNSEQPFRAQLNYLRLPAASEKNSGDEKNIDAETSRDDSPIAHADPRDVAAIDLRIDHLWRGDEELGWVETQLRPIANGLLLDNLQGQLRAVKIQPRDTQPARLTWTRTDAGDRSEFSGQLAVDDIGKALQRWHYETVMTSKRGRADFALQWPGRPDQFKFLQAAGSADLHIDDGRFLRASGSTTGALKVVGVFNFANFLRRLQLDFSDVFKDGVSFDDMHGTLSTQSGLLKIEQPVEIKSPSSRFRLAGQIDFNRDQTDMELVATLPVASNLPWIAALAGGLPVAAGAYVASKVFENQFDKFSSAAYAITGPWSEPQVKLRRVFDDKLPANESSSKKNDSPAEVAP